MKLKVRTILALSSVLLAVVAISFYLRKMQGGGDLVASYQGLVYKWGTGDTLQNAYDSRTGKYQYLDRNNKLVQTQFKLRGHHLIYLFSKINEEKLFDLPDTLANTRPIDPNVPRYEFLFLNENGAKRFVFLTDYDKDAELASKAKKMQQLLQNMIDEANECYGHQQ